MARLSNWFVNRKENLVFLIAVLVSLRLIFWEENSQTQTLRAWALAGFGYMLDKISVIQDFDALREENEQLRLQNAELLLEVSRLNEAALENIRLRDLLDFKAESQLDLIPAKVIGKENNGFLNSIILAAGGVDSVRKNLALVTAQGVVGKIFNVGEHQSTAQLLIDRNFRASAMVQRSRVTGIVKWFQGNQVVLAEVPKRSDVRVGDVIITSGFSTIFPAGLEIGYVIRSQDEEEGMFMDILIQPSVDFSKLEEVFILKQKPLQLSPTI